MTHLTELSKGGEADQRIDEPFFEIGILIVVVTKTILSQFRAS